MTVLTKEQLERIATLYPDLLENLNQVIESTDVLNNTEEEFYEDEEFDEVYPDEYDDCDEDYDFDDEDDAEELDGTLCVVASTSSRISIYVNDIAYAFNVSEVPLLISGLVKRLVSAQSQDDLLLTDGEIQQLKDAQTPRLAKLIKQASQGDITIVDGVVTLDNNEINSNNIETLLEMASNNDIKGIKRFIRFQRSLENNTSARIISRLLAFIKCTSINIDDDGYIIAYKAINADLYDCYTGRTYLNKPGAVIEMPRKKVDDDDSRTCSTGLHVCSINYLKGFYWSVNKRLAIVKIKPEDFVSIPVDYNDAKARVCKYTVLKVCDIEEAEEILGTTFRDISDDGVEDYDEDYVDFSDLI